MMDIIENTSFDLDTIINDYMNGEAHDYLYIYSDSKTHSDTLNIIFSLSIDFSGEHSFHRSFFVRENFFEYDEDNDFETYTREIKEFSIYNYMDKEKKDWNKACKNCEKDLMKFLKSQFDYYKEIRSVKY